MIVSLHSHGRTGQWGRRCSEILQWQMRGEQWPICRWRSMRCLHWMQEGCSGRETLPRWFVVPRPRQSLHLPVPIPHRCGLHPPRQDSTTSGKWHYPDGALSGYLSIIFHTKQPTEDCPHQFGYYRLGDAAHCGQFKTCSQGAGFTLDCPEGLAFNKNTYQCDWPDLVPDCDVEAFLGFKCPAAPAGLGFPSARFHKSDDCQRFFLCSEGSTRLYRCGPGTAYSEDVGACDAAENVHGCEHLRIEHDDEEDAKKYNLKIKA